jgi:hypothetical protein
LSSSTTENPVFHAFGRGALALTRRPILWSIIIGCLYLAVSLHTSGPAYLEDEIGYLANAAFFAGHRIDAASSYHAGYSLLLAPAFLLGEPNSVWKAVLVINAILWTVSFAMLYAILRRLLPHAKASHLLTMTIVSALYPTWIVSAGYAFATTAFVTVFLASILALFLWSTENPLSILPHSALVGFLYWVHPTGAAVALASILAVTLEAWRRRDAKPLLLHVVLVVALILAYQRGIHPWIAAAMTPPGYTPHFHYPSPLSALRTVLTVHGFAIFATVLIGQFAYFIVASFGMTVAALLFCARRSLRPRDAKDAHTEDANARAICILIGTAPLAIMALGAISFFQWEHFEGDLWIYGRYLDGAVLPLLALGLAVFRPDIRLAALSIFLLAAGVLLTAMVPPGTTPNIVNTVSFWPQYLDTNGSFLAWMVFGAVAVAGVARFGRGLAIALMAAAFFLAIPDQIVWHDAILANFSAPAPLVATIRSHVPRGTCVGFNPTLPAEATLFQSERYHLNSFYLFDYAYRRMSPAEWLEQCDGPYLTYDVSGLERPGLALSIARDIKSGLLLVQRINGEAAAGDAPDQVNAVRAALRGTSSAAGLHITTEAPGAEPPKKTDAVPPMSPGGGGGGGMDF